MGKRIVTGRVDNSGQGEILISDYRLKAFSQYIQEGRVLLMVDVPSGRVSELSELIKQHHPEVDNKGIEPTIPAFP